MNSRTLSITPANAQVASGIGKSPMASTAHLQLRLGIRASRQFHSEPSRCSALGDAGTGSFLFSLCLVSYLVVTTYVGGPGLFMGQECPARPRIRSGSSRPRWRVWAQGTAFLVPALLAPGSHASVAGSPPTRALTFADSRTASGLNHGCERHGRPGARELAAELR